jgi:acetyl-CoA synthetase
LANPEIVDSIRHYVQSEKVARGESPRELSPQEMEELKAFGQAE